MGDQKRQTVTEEDFQRDMAEASGDRDRAEQLGLYDDFQESAGRRSRKKHKKEKKVKNGGGGRGGRRGGRKVLTKEERKKRRLKTVTVVLCALLVLAGSAYVLARGYISSKLSKANHMEVSADEWGIDSQVAADLDGYKNIALLGVDTREVYGETDDSGVRSDAIIIVTINEKTNEVYLTSVLRDSYLDLEENGVHTIDKVTHAHAYGGPVDTVRALNRNLDLNIDDFVRVNWGTVADIVDAMGGLEINVPEEQIDELNECARGTYTAIGGEYQPVRKAGLQTLNGVSVVAYCRIRYVDGDEQRTDRTREVIMAAIDKAKQMSLSDLNNVIDVGMSEITTSMDTSTMMDLLLNLSKYDFQDTSSWPYDYEGVYINNVWYDCPVTLKSNVQELHKDLFGQKNYQPTENVLAINEQIKYESQYYGDEDLDWTLLDKYQELFGSSGG